MSGRSRLIGALIVFAALSFAPVLRARAQQVEAQRDPFEAALATAAATARIDSPPATLVYVNRPIVELRATVLSRTPEARVATAVDVLNRLVAQQANTRVSTRGYGDIWVISVGDQRILGIAPQDVDSLVGESVSTKAADAAARLQVAVNEAVELRAPGGLLRSGVLAALGTLVFVLLLTLVIRFDRRVAGRLSRSAERQLERMPGVDVLTQVADPRVWVRRLLALVTIVVSLALAYTWLAFVLRRFPYTRPWGESLRGGLLSALAAGGRSFVDQLPNLLALVGIFLVTRFFVRLTNLAFLAVEQGRLTIPWVHPETAQPTRRIASALLWLFALVLSYEYLPGADSDAFKGISVFVGLIISLGSTGVMNQAMSGLMVMYSRALRRGDFVRVADVEGTVIHLGALSTKIRTPRNEEITIPNAIMVSHATTNYSRNADSGVRQPTSVTIGYDVPWRQVHALLLLAAERTPGVRSDPRPVVLQEALCDFYVKYTLLLCLEQPERRLAVLAGLHANIQDAFNEYGVQIMSPSYEADPDAPKVVPRSRWYSAPAAQAAETSPQPGTAKNTGQEIVAG
jgi:small-conductance mechanosensitive channel